MLIIIFEKCLPLLVSIMFEMYSKSGLGLKFWALALENMEKVVFWPSASVKAKSNVN